jgi:predicted RNA methylase
MSQDNQTRNPSIPNQVSSISIRKNGEIIMTIQCEHETMDDNGYAVDSWVLIKDWHISGMGETIEQLYECPICRKLKREVYMHACTVDEEGNSI